MTIKKIRIFLIAMSFLLTFIVLSFTGGINILSFKQNYTDSVLSSYHVLAGETVSKIEYAIKYGKPLTNFYGIEELLESKKSDSEYIEEVYIALPFGSVIYNQDGVILEELDDEVQNEMQFIKSDDLYKSIYFNGKYELFLPIRDSDDQWIGSMGLTLSDEVVSGKTNDYRNDSIIMLAIFGFISAIIFLLTITRLPIVSVDKKIYKKRLLGVILTVLGLIQIAFGTINYVTLQDAYKESVSENAEIILQVVENDIEHVIGNGVTYRQLYRLDVYLNNIVQSVPEVDRISIIDQTYASDFNSEKQYGSSRNLVVDSENNSNFIAEINLSEEYIDGHMREMLLDTATVVVLSILIMIEVSLFCLMYVRRKIVAAEVKLSNQTESNRDSNQSILTDEDRLLIRPLSFIIFGAVFLSAAFIPIYMKSIYDPGIGLSESMFAAIPISIEFMMALFSFILYQSRVEIKGWKPIFLLGVIFIGTGSFFSWVSWDILSFVLSRGIVGFGFGLAFLSMRSYILADHSTNRRNRSMHSFQVGSFTGMFTGIVIGAMVADRIGFSEVFIVAIVVSVLAYFFAWKMMGNISKRKLPRRHVVTRALPKANSISFLFNKEIFSLFFFIIIPLSIAGMFLYYLFPVYANEEGVSLSNIGRAFLINGLIIIYLGPWLRQKMNSYLSNQGIIFLGGVLVSISLFIFAFQLSIFYAFSAVILMGLALSLALHSQYSYFINHSFARSVGEVKALRYHSIFERLGQMFGPVLFALIILNGIQEGLILLAISILIFTLIFYFATRKKKNDAQVIDS